MIQKRNITLDDSKCPCIVDVKVFTVPSNVVSFKRTIQTGFVKNCIILLEQKQRIEELVK